MQAGDIVLLSLRQANGQIKNRPVLLLKKMPPFGDWLVCGISSQLQQEVKSFDHLITRSDPSFSATGLRAPSLIRLGFLDTIEQQSIPGSIGSIESSVLKLLLKRLAVYISS